MKKEKQEIFFGMCSDLIEMKHILVGAVTFNEKKEMCIAFLGTEEENKIWFQKLRAFLDKNDRTPFSHTEHEVKPSN